MQCSLRVFCFFAVASLVLLPGCMSLPAGEPDGPWHEVYEPINDPASEAFIAQALVKAQAEFGAPVIPVNEVLLRRSRKRAEARHYRIGEDFSLTECADSTNGVFVIYLAVDPGHANYYALLGHECAHLMDAGIFDWYMEGLATLFSEELCEQEGQAWGNWQRHFEKTRREPYGLSYRMMKELKSAFPDHYPFLIRHARPIGGENPHRRIDIDAWIATLAPSQRAQAREIIAEYAAALEKRVSDQYAFYPPASPAR